MSDLIQKFPSIMPPDIIVHYETIDGVEYGCCYWNAIKRRVPKNDYVDLDDFNNMASDKEIAELNKAITHVSTLVGANKKHHYLQQQFHLTN